MIANARNTPPDLDEARGTKTTSKYGEEPAVFLREFADDEEEDAPHDAEEDNTQDEL